jgi:hypothetical protein
LTERALRERGHGVVAPDLPCDDDSAGRWDYADTVTEAVGDRRELGVVAQSAGAYMAPLVCARVPVELLVLVAGLVPKPGEAPSDSRSGRRFDTRCCFSWCVEAEGEVLG